MPSPFNDNKQGFDKNDKKPSKKLSRTTILTIVTIAIAIIIVTVAAVVANRTNKPTTLPEDTSATDAPATEKPTDSIEAPTDTPTEKPTEKPSGSTNVGNKLPSFILPVSGVLSSKHNPDMQVYSSTMKDYRVHLGVDLITKENAPVYAAADGKITKIWNDPLMGYCIAISHAGESVSIYKNLAETLPQGIAEGVSVRAGQLIANVGDSASVEVAMEPHLHFEMTVSDLAVDPLKYFDEASLESIKADTTHE